MRALAINAWRFSLPGSDGRPCWDQIAKFGEFSKEGEEVIFSAETLGQMLKNFAARKNDIGMDYEHQALNTALNGQPAPALAFYNALALVESGRLVDFASHDSSVQPPADTSAMPDGLYAYRSEVTPLGQNLLSSYKYISPAFVTEGTDEQGQPVGYDLLNIAATNTPFLDGMEPITYHRLERKVKRMAFDKKLLAKLGLGDDASPEDAADAMAKFMTAYDEKCAAMEADLKDKGEQLAAMKAAKMGAAEGQAAAMADDDKKDDAAQMSDDKKDDAAAMADDEQTAAQGMADDEKKDDAAAYDAKDGDGDADEDDEKKFSKALGVDVKQTKLAYATFRAKFVPMSEFSAVSRELAQMKAERDAALQAETERKVSAFVDSAIEKGRYRKEKRDNLFALAKLDMKIAEGALESEGTYLAKAPVLQRMTAGGSPVGASREADQTTIAAPTEKRQVVFMGQEFSNQAKAYAKANNVDIATAQRAIAKERPDLAEAYLKGE